MNQNLPTFTIQLRDPRDDAQWEDIATDFFIAPNAIYLNHGSFGIPSKQARYAQRGYRTLMNENPMDFYLIQAEKIHAESKQRLAEFVGTSPDHLVFVDNATYGMSLIAANFPLKPNDEIVLTDHEYVPVTRMWQQRCEQVGAKLVIAQLPDGIESDEQIVTALTGTINDRTKLFVISHITSPTALILPVGKLCPILHAAQIPVCIDGPHAPAQIELDIDHLKCDFYVASCHKWLCAPLGTGFLYVHPRWQSTIVPAVKGWGRLPPANIERWADQFFWLGTRDLSQFFAIPAAIDHFVHLGLENFRARSHWLASYAETALCDLFQTQPIAKREQGHYASMAHVPLPPGDWSQLQRTLKSEMGFEVMINQFGGRWFVRVSCHLYTNTRQIDLLIKTLASLRVAGPVRQ
jgi:isopenicillin-N epimerase